MRCGNEQMVRIFLTAAVAFTFTTSSLAQQTDWQHQGTFHIVTTPEGANLPGSATVENFPLLVRLDKDFFNFDQANKDGSDIRFFLDKEELAYEIESWDPINQTAAIWVRIPSIRGNSIQPVSMRWGNKLAKPASDGAKVFNESNGYLGVIHMNSSLEDVVGNLQCTDRNTSESAGIIGQARKLAGAQGIFCGDKIQTLPTGSEPHSTEAWFRATEPNTRVVGWGNEQGQGKVVMEYRSPPHVRMDCYFSDGNVNSNGRIQSNQWVHVVHTYQKGNARIYINGRLDGVNQSSGSTLDIQRPARMWIGGWYNNYNFVGNIDEVRISSVTRSPEWIKLQYENQKPMQTLLGHLVRKSENFSLSKESVSVNEGESVIVSANDGGAIKTYWILKDSEGEEVVEVDRSTFTFRAERTTGDQVATLKFRAVYKLDVKELEVPIQIRECIPEPKFSLTAPAVWNGRSSIVLRPKISNLKILKENKIDALNFSWKADGLAVIKKTSPGQLELRRAQNSGKLRVTLSIDNGGTPVTQSVEIDVKQPTTDKWVTRAPGKNEKPADNQFYARSKDNWGMLHFNGKTDDPADAVFLKIFADDKLYTDLSKQLDSNKEYRFSVKLKPGLIKYRVEFGSVMDGKSKLLYQAKNIVCGDAYIIQGQSNAEAFDGGRAVNAFKSEWVRSFGSPQADEKRARTKSWGNAVSFDRDGWDHQVGYWGMELAKQIIERHQVPVCLINGAKGGTRIDQHQKNEIEPTDVQSIYGRLLWRVQQARLTHGIRAVIWHQGENDQGAAGPTGGFGWEDYQDYFIELAADWKEDFPNIENYYLFQIWPKACSMGTNGSDDRLREVQRQLAKQFSNLHVMSTLGIRPGGGCHYPAEGYAKIGQLIYPLIARDFYGAKSEQSITPPNLIRAALSGDKKDQVVLTFDQKMAWNDSSKDLFYCGMKSLKILSGKALGNTITLQLATPPSKSKLTYVFGNHWNERKNPLRGANGIAALSFCDAPLAIN